MPRAEGEDPGTRPDLGLLALSRAYASAILAADEPEAERTVRAALRQGFSWSQIDDHVIAPALWLVGELWELGEITVADEHVATEITLRVLALQCEAQRLEAERREYRIMLATAAGERHDVALRMAGQLLDAARYETIMVGSDVPADELAICAARLAPDVVCLSLTMADRAPQLVGAMEAVHRLVPHAAFLLGGRGLRSIVPTAPVVATCAEVSGAVETVDALVKRAATN